MTVGLFTRILLRNERLCTPPERLPHRGRPASRHKEAGRP